jgi:hypothetical protein
VFRVLLVQHGCRYIRDISPCITFACHINLELFDPENVLEVLEETKEVCGDIFFARCCYISEGEPGADGLFDPESRLAYAWDGRRALNERGFRTITRSLDSPMSRD